MLRFRVKQYTQLMLVYIGYCIRFPVIATTAQELIHHIAICRTHVQVHVDDHWLFYQRIAIGEAIGKSKGKATEQSNRNRQKAPEIDSTKAHPPTGGAASTEYRDGRSVNNCRSPVKVALIRGSYQEDAIG